MLSPISTRIYQRDGATKIQLDAIHNPDGSLTISGYDLGDAPMQSYGREDLEYELTIPAKEVPRLLAALLQAFLTNTEMPVTTLRTLLDQNQITHRFRCVP